MKIEPHPRLSVNKTSGKTVKDVSGRAVRLHLAIVALSSHPSVLCAIDSRSSVEKCRPIGRKNAQVQLVLHLPTTRLGARSYPKVNERGSHGVVDGCALAIFFEADHHGKRNWLRVGPCPAFIGRDG